MRTTLDLEDAVLSAARAKARAEGISLGRAVSELARRGIAAPSTDERGAGVPPTPGFPVLRGDPEHVVTDELVARHRDDQP